MTPMAYVVRDRDGQLRAILPDQEGRRGSIAVELAHWRRKGCSVTHEPREGIRLQGVRS